MEIKAISEALKYLQEQRIRKAVIVTDSMSTLQKVKKEYMYADWMKALQDRALEKLTFVYSPGHAGVSGNERADSLAGTAAIDNNLILDPPSVLHVSNSSFLTSECKALLTLCLDFKRKGFKPVKGCRVPSGVQPDAG